MHQCSNAPIHQEHAGGPRPRQAVPLLQLPLHRARAHARLRLHALLRARQRRRAAQRERLAPGLRRERHGRARPVRTIVKCCGEASGGSGVRATRPSSVRFCPPPSYPEPTQKAHLRRSPLRPQHPCWPCSPSRSHSLPRARG
eukprot:scaffold56682_cov75-Phaeocystis_antarctica.AAC.2